VARLSTSDPTVWLSAGTEALYGLAKIVDKFLDVWKKVQKIREARTNFVELGLSNTKAVNELDTIIDAKVKEAVDQSIAEIMQGSPLESGRKNELTGFLQKETIKLYVQIERGLNIEIKVSDDARLDDESGQKIRELRTLAVKLDYPKVTGLHPVLSLPPGSDGDENNADAPTASPKYKRKKSKRKKGDKTYEAGSGS
jgi:hypothetical protein